MKVGRTEGSDGAETQLGHEKDHTYATFPIK